jgi:membrane protease YdiL (CAAX protease family)
LHTQTEQPSPTNDPALPSTATPPNVSPSTLHRIFFGAEGLRAGWSVLIFAALFAAFLFTVRTIGQIVHPPTHHASPSDTFSLGHMLINESVPLLGVLLITWIMSKIERRPQAIYGLGGARKLSRFFAGLAWGVTCLTLLILVLWKTGFLVFDGRLVFGSDVLRYGAGWLLGFLIVALLEECFTRGYLQYTLTRGLAGLYQSIFKTRHNAALGFWTSALILSVLFGAVHSSNPGESPIGLLTASLASMVFCLSLWRTGSLWWAIGFHTSWDWAQSFLSGVADSGIMAQHHLLATHPAGKLLLSGGATGPEGSIFVLAILTLITLIILFTLPRTNQGPLISAFDTIKPHRSLISNLPAR